MLNRVDLISILLNFVDKGCCIDCILACGSDDITIEYCISITISTVSVRVLNTKFHGCTSLTGAGARCGVACGVPNSGAR